MFSKYQKNWKKLKEEEKKKIEELKKKLAKTLTSTDPKEILEGLNAYHTLRSIRRN